MAFTVESLRERLEEHRLPVWTAAEFQERMEGFESYFLGEGFSGVSYLMTKGECGVVVKDMKSNDVDLLRQEILSLVHVCGMPGTQQIAGMCIEDDQFSIENDCLSAEQKEDILAQLTDVMQRLHDSGLAHGDLHEDNVCVDIEGDRVTACVIDFGSSFFRHDQREFEGARQHDQDHLQSIERRMKGAPTTDSDVDWEADFYVELNGSWGDSRGGSPWEDSTDPELEQVTDLLSEWQFDVASDTEGRISPEGEGLLRQDE